MVNPNLWGPPGWKFIHYTALGYPEKPSLQDKNNYKIFFNNLKNILPCLLCRNNYRTHIQQHPIDNHLDSNIDLFNWTIDIHNMTNKENNKRIYSYDEAYELYTKKFYERYDNIYIIIIFLLVILLFVYIFKKCTCRK